TSEVDLLGVGRHMAGHPASVA
ncbi:MAG: hypothetical protein QOD29_4444, partial [Alphaproteobacteria bacterium]|nr:hypothetical protein [Alphaproteobacteria bacterium]